MPIALICYRPRERGLGAALAVGGYRTALLCTGAGALILADQIGWQFTYWLLAGLDRWSVWPVPGSGPNPLQGGTATGRPACARFVDPFRDFPVTRERALASAAAV
jgi:MFS transporter, PAT family, beta-lactamase induction signal transducer AmpG